MSIIEDIKKKAVSFHKGVERFFDDRIAEATVNKMLAAIVIPGLIAGIIDILMTYGYDLGRIVTALKLNSQTILLSFLEYFILIELYLLFLTTISALSAWIVKRLNKNTTKIRQPKVVQLIYSYFVLWAALFSVSLLFLIIATLHLDGATFNLISNFLQILLAILFAYLLLVVFLRLFRPSFVEYIEILITSFIMSFVTVAAIWGIVLAIGLIGLTIQRFLG